MTIAPLEEKLLPALHRFLAKYYVHIPVKANRGFFDWKFRQNPVGDPLPGYYVAVDGENVVGQVASIPDRLWVAGEWRPISWMVDLAVDPDYRNRHTGLHLIRALMPAGGITMASGVCKGLIEMYEGLGWRKLRLSETFYSIARPSAMLAVAGQNNSDFIPQAARRMQGLLSLADTVLPLVQKSYGWRGHLPSGIYLEPLERFDGSVDGLIGEALPSLGNTTFRSSEHLSWKFTRCPYGQYFALAARSKAGGGLRGYVVVKVLSLGDVRWADIADILVHGDEGEVFDCLVHAAHSEALKRGSQFVRFRCSMPGHFARLKKPFWLRHTRSVVDEVLVHCRDTQFLKAIQTGPWHLTGVVADRVDDGRNDA